MMLAIGWTTKFVVVLRVGIWARQNANTQKSSSIANVCYRYSGVLWGKTSPADTPKFVSSFYLNLCLIEERGPLAGTCG